MGNNLYPIHGTLTTPLYLNDKVMQVDTALHAYLVANLPVDGAYLLLTDGCQAEVVLAKNVNGIITIVRAQDYTECCNWSAGASIKYVLTLPEICNTRIPPLTLHPLGAMSITDGIYYMMPTFTTYNETEVVVTSNNILISKYWRAYGCCAVTEAVPAENYTYLTSKLYPIQDLVWAESAAKLYRVEAIQWPIDFVSSRGNLQYFAVAGGHEEYKNYKDMYLNSRGGLQSFAVAGGHEEYSFNDMYLSSQGSLQSFTVAGGHVEYGYKDMYLNSGANITSLAIS